jgi:hypothetical protein
MHAVIRMGLVGVLALWLGLHWALLQTLAWTGMIVTYSRQDSFTEAISKTFDGQHPCPLCRAIQKGRAEEKKQAPAGFVVKLDLGPVWQPVEFDFRCPRDRVPLCDATASLLHHRPPKPPPRGALPDTPV